MKKWNFIFILMCSCFIFFLSFETVSAQNVKLIALSSREGTQLFLRSFFPDTFWPIILQYTTQKNSRYCSIASSVIVLNALKVPSPSDPAIQPFHFFTQDNFFTPKVEKRLPARSVQKHGATLDEISVALKSFPVSVQTLHANTFSKSRFRVLASTVLHHRGSFIIVNYLRKSISQNGTGHMSPLAAYDRQSDRFLVLDVSRYRYPPVWVKTDDLWHAMHTYDKEGHAFRGMIIVSKVVNQSAVEFEHDANGIFHVN